MNQPEGLKVEAQFGDELWWTWKDQDGDKIRIIHSTNYSRLYIKEMNGGNGGVYVPVEVFAYIASRVLEIETAKLKETV
jgi:hypothetical protein